MAVRDEEDPIRSEEEDNNGNEMMMIMPTDATRLPLDEGRLHSNPLSWKQFGAWIQFINDSLNQMTIYSWIVLSLAVKE